VRTLHVDTGREMRGGQWQALSLIEKLAGAGHTAKLLTPAGSGLNAEASKRGLDVANLGWGALLRESRRHDLVHAHDAKAHTMAAIVGGAPLVVSRRVAFPVKSGVLSRWKYARARMYLAVSKNVALQLMARGIGESKIRVVYDGVIVPPPGNPAPGRVVALAIKPVEIPGIQVHYTSDLWHDLASASVFVYKSEMEGLGSAALAAMANGVPVVASGVGGLPEIVEQGVTGLIVNNGDFAGAVRSLLNDPEKAAEMGRRGRELVRRKFTVDVMVEKTLAAYREALA